MRGRILPLAAAAVAACVAGAAIWSLTRPVPPERATREQLAERLAQQPSGPPEIAYWYARRSLDGGDVRSAERALLELNAAQPDYIPAVTELGKLYLAQGRVDQAFPLLKSAVGRDPGSLEPRIALAQLYRSQGAHHRSIAVLKEGMAVQSGNARAAYELAAAHASAQQLSEAEQVLRQALAANPADPQILIALGRVLRLRGNNTEAETFIGKALELAPKDIRGRLERARLLWLGDVGSREQALTLLAALSKEAPDDAAVLLETGKAASKLRRYPEAVTVLQKVVSLEQENQEAYFLLAGAYRNLRQEQQARHASATFERLRTYKAQLQDLGARLGAHPESVDLRLRIAEVHHRNGYADRALQSVRIALQYAPSNIAARQKLAQLEAVTNGTSQVSSPAGTAGGTTP